MKYLLIAIMFTYLMSFKPQENHYSQYFCEVEYTDFGKSDDLLNFTKDGLVCSKIDINGKKKVEFFPREKLNNNSVVQLQKFILERRFINDSNYYENNKGRVLGGWTYTFVIRHRSEFNVIHYRVCKDRDLDSLIFYMNQIIPAQKREKFEIDILEDSSFDGCTKKNKP